MKRPILYPDRVAIAKFDTLAAFAEDAGTVTSPSIHSINSFFTSGYNKIRLGTEGIQVNHQESAIDIEQITAAGVQIADVIRQTRNVQITMTASAWDLAIEALLEGKNFDDIVDDAQAVQAGSGYTFDTDTYTAPAQDVTNAAGVKKGDTIYREKFSLLFRCPIKGGYLYFLAPKVVVRPDNRDTTILLQQSKPAIVMQALSLDDDEVAPFVNLYSEVSQFGLIYKFEIPDA